MAVNRRIARILAGTERRNHRIERQQKLSDAPVVTIVLGVASRSNQKSMIDLFDSEDRVTIGRDKRAALNPRVADAMTAFSTVQKRHVAGIDPALDCLRPIALLQAFDCSSLTCGQA